MGDLIEALACQDKLCALVSAVGMAENSLQICISFVPGLNIIALIITPVPLVYKTFVLLL